MLRHVLLLTLALAVVTCTEMHGQAVCSSTSLTDNLICLTPQLYSASGVNLPNQAHRAHFDNDFETRATALNAALGTQLASLRLASPASGIIFAFDKSLGVVTRMSESYGPILGERAETIGRHRLFVAATYQFFPFSSLDGINLKRVPAQFTHADSVNPNGSARNAATDPPSPGIPGVELEYIRTTNRIDLKVHQVTFYATYGLTNRIDVSAAVPVLNVRMGVSSNATIIREDDPLQQPLTPSSDPVLQRLYAGTGPMVGCANTAPPSCTGFFHYFDPTNPAGSISANFSRFRSATGIGDVMFRVKGTVLKGERAAVAFGTDVRAPTGDEKNFLGAGAPGVKPFIAASYRSRVSPHVDIGYQFNGSSILAGDLTTGKTARLPDQFVYSGGVDVGLTKRLTAAVDLLGQRLFGAPRIVQSTFVNLNGKVHSSEFQISQAHGSYNQNDLAVGAKFSPAGNFLVTGNVLFKLDDGGLRAKVVPLVGVSYTF